MAWGKFIGLGNKPLSVNDGDNNETSATYGVAAKTYEECRLVFKIFDDEMTGVMLWLFFLEEGIQKIEQDGKWRRGVSRKERGILKLGIKTDGCLEEFKVKVGLEPKVQGGINFACKEEWGEGTKIWRAPQYLFGKILYFMILFDLYNSWVKDSNFHFTGGKLSLKVISQLTQGNDAVEGQLQEPCLFHHTQAWNNVFKSWADPFHLHLFNTGPFQWRRRKAKRYLSLQPIV